MSTAGQFSSKNPTIKRILKEAAELANHPSTEFHARPLENDLFEWHFTLRGPPAPSPYEGGVYHGRIVLPPAYPLKPPSFRFLTPTGRFEVNREICLSISGHHEETWQPAWGIRTALVAIRSFMDTAATGQVGGMDASDEVRRRMAVQSKTSRCNACGKSNEEIMKENDADIKEHGEQDVRQENTVPEELRLAYREDIGKNEKLDDVKKQDQGEEGIIGPGPAHLPSPSSHQVSPDAASSPPVQQRVMVNEAPAQLEGHANGIPDWVDKAIWGIVLALIFLVWKKFIL